MSVVTIYKFDNLPGPWEIVKKVNGQKRGDSWATSFVSRYNKNEVVVNYWFYENLEENIKKVLDEDESMEVVSFLQQNGKLRSLNRIHCFINFVMKTLEIYTGSEKRIDQIAGFLEDILEIKFERVKLTTTELQTIYENHSNELKQVMFKNVEGLFYEIMRGNSLETNEKFKQYIGKFPESLRVISFRPRIKFLGGYNRYQVTLNGDRGTLKFSSPNEKFPFRPRLEVRQLTFLIAATLGFLR